MVRQGLSTWSIEELRQIFVNESEAAKELEVSRRTIVRWVRVGKLLGHKAWGVVLIERAEVTRLKAGR